MQNVGAQDLRQRARVRCKVHVFALRRGCKSATQKVPCLPGEPRWPKKVPGWSGTWPTRPAFNFKP
jgi:hypothetical protein